MNVCLITDCGLTRTHGVGAQLLSILGTKPEEYFHFYFGQSNHGPSEVDHSLMLENRPPWLPRGTRIQKRVQWMMGLNLWDGERLNRQRFLAIVKERKLRFAVAYVIVGSDASAARASEMLQALALPYAVHMMDLFHKDGLEVEKMPGFARLFGGAGAVLALTDSLAREAEKFAIPPVERVFIGQPVSKIVATAPHDGETFRIVLSGRPYRQGCEMLAQTWPFIASRFPDVELLYVGPYFQELPEALRPHAHNAGYVPQREAYERILAGCHCAFLSGPSVLDCFGKFSFPSRVTDYLMAGLPTLACVAAGSAAESLLSELSPTAVQFTRTPQELVDGLEAVHNFKGMWQRAHQAARQFALDRLSIDAVRAKVFSALRRVAATNADVC